MRSVAAAIKGRFGGRRGLILKSLPGGTGIAVPDACSRVRPYGDPTTGSTRVHARDHVRFRRELSRACQSPMVTADISAILWIRIAVIEGLGERDEDLGTRRT